MTTLEIRGKRFWECDELIISPAYPLHAIARDGDKWFLVGSGIDKPRPFLAIPHGMRAEYNYEFHIYECCPRGGFKEPTPPRAATEDEIRELSDRFDRIEEREIAFGAIYGENATAKINVAVFKAKGKPIDAILTESEIRERENAFYAFNSSPGILEVRI